jgi:hypothetical protein
MYIYGIYLKNIMDYANGDELVMYFLYFSFRVTGDFLWVLMQNVLISRLTSSDLHNSAHSVSLDSRICFKDPVLMHRFTL